METMEVVTGILSEIGFASFSLKIQNGIGHSFVLSDSNTLNYIPLNFFTIIMICHRIFVRFINFLPMLSLLFLLLSCEEKIQVDLINETPKVVIESYITNEEGPVFVKISKSQDFFNQGNFSSINNADVQLEYLSVKEKLADRGDGYYVSSKLKGIPGTDYKLQITSDNETFGASVELPKSVPIDTIYFQPGLFRNDSLNICIEFKDPAITENYYRIKIYRNRRYAVNDYFLLTDAFSDGERIVAPIYYRYFAPRDTVFVQLLNLEKNTWKYFKGLSEAIQQGVNSQAPGNPPTNFSGGALGIFGAWGTSSYRVIVPEITTKK
jgi:hypothetical protein